MPQGHLIRPRLDVLIQHDQHGINIRRQERNHLEQIRARFPCRIRVKPLHRRTLPLPRLSDSRRRRPAPILCGTAEDTAFPDVGGKRRRPVVFCHFKEFIELGCDDGVDSVLGEFNGGLEGGGRLEGEDGAG
jgi:hypothetical protein